MKKIAILSVFLINAICVYAQKLPNVQQTSLRAPASTKIDGKATEWNNQFQAYNKATDLYYTMSNDRENLYLVAQTTDPNVINFKIFDGGLRLIIQKNGKNDKNAASITYPVTEGKGRVIFRLRPGKGQFDDTTANFLDSTMKQNNITLSQKCKWIKITGIPDLDTLSVYNNDGIKAAGLFDIKKAYTIEMAISLKLLGLSTADATKFTYHITVGNNSGKTTSIVSSPQAGASAQEIQVVNRLNDIAASLSAPTDFWGKYTLAK